MINQALMIIEYLILKIISILKFLIKFCYILSNALQYQQLVMSSLRKLFANSHKKQQKQLSPQPKIHVPTSPQFSHIKFCEENIKIGQHYKGTGLNNAIYRDHEFDNRRKNRSASKRRRPIFEHANDYSMQKGSKIMHDQWQEIENKYMHKGRGLKGLNVQMLDYSTDKAPYASFQDSHKYIGHINHNNLNRGSAPIHYNLGVSNSTHIPFNMTQTYPFNSLHSSVSKTVNNCSVPVPGSFAVAGGPYSPFQIVTNVVRPVTQPPQQYVQQNSYARINMNMGGMKISSQPAEPINKFQRRSKQIGKNNTGNISGIMNPNDLADLVYQTRLSHYRKHHGQRH